MRAVSVIIPVYNAFNESLECLQSLRKHTPSEVKIHVIDDCSTEGEFISLASEFLEDKQFKFERNEVNLGFVKTCNKGMLNCPEDDVILLNSDTIVTANWVKKLQAAAYSSDEVGSVTPLSNNGVIASVPNFCQENIIPAKLSLDQFAALVQSVAKTEYPELPTCMGFCVYLKRNALDLVGLFDEKVFGRGYGEENDLSNRLQAKGFKDILDDSTYIYHKGNCSFLGLKDDLTVTNGEIIKQRYPHYFDRVSKFCSRNPLNPIQGRIVDELVELWNEDRRRVLHIVHNGPFISRGDPLGGTEKHVADLISNDFSSAHWSLVPGKRCYHLSAHLPGCNREYIFDLGKTSLEKILSSDFFDIVHLHHSRWLDHIELCQALANNANHIVSFHDYTLVCPRFHLYTPFHKACNGFECKTACGYSMEYINDLRAETIRALDSAKLLCCFSDSTRLTIERLLGKEFNWLKIPHGIHDKQQSEQMAATDYLFEQPFKIALLGLIPQHKGSLILDKLMQHQEIAGQPVEWHVFGRLFLEPPSHVVLHGEYKRGQLKDMLIAEKPHLALFLSICPETYSLTLDEAWNAKIPALTTPLGAQAERVRESGAGWVLDNLEPETIYKRLEEIISNRLELKKAYAAISNTKVISVKQEVAMYTEMYEKQFLENKASSYSLLLKYLAQNGLAKAPRANILWRIGGRGVSILIHTLDSLRVRGYVQRAAYRLFPRKFLLLLKGSR